MSEQQKDTAGALSESKPDAAGAPSGSQPVAPSGSQPDTPATPSGSQPPSSPGTMHHLATLALIGSLVLIVVLLLNQPISLGERVQLQFPLWLGICSLIINLLLLAYLLTTYIHVWSCNFYHWEAIRLHNEVNAAIQRNKLLEVRAAGQIKQTAYEATRQAEEAKRKQAKLEQKEQEKRQTQAQKAAEKEKKAAEKQTKSLQKAQRKQKSRPAPSKPELKRPAQPPVAEAKPHDAPGQHPSHPPMDGLEQHSMPPSQDVPDEHSIQSAARVSLQEQAISASAWSYPPPEQTQQPPPFLEEPPKEPDRRYDSRYEKAYQEHQSPITALLWLPTATGLIFACDDQSVWCWEPDNNEPAARLGEPTFPIAALAWFAQAEQNIMAYGKHHKMVLWGGINEKVAYAHGHHNKDVTALAVSPDGKYLASGGADHRVYICSLEQGHTLYAIYPGHGAPIRDIAWSPSGDFMASTDENNYLLVWSPHASGGNTIPVTQYQGHHQHCKVSVAHQGGKPRQGVSALAWEPGGKRIASAGELDYHVHIWSPFSGGAEVFYPHNKQVCMITWEPGGKHFAAATRDGLVSIWDSLNKKLVFTYRAHKDAVTHMTWAHDGRIATASKDGTIRLWVPKTTL